MTYDERIQLIMVGESGVGKTSLIRRYTNNIFNTNHLETIGIEFFNKEERINDQIIQIKLWDTAGQERFKSVSVKNLRYSQAAVVVFDLTVKESFNKVTDWLKEIRDYSPKMPVGLFGNKSDLVEERQVKQEDIDDLCKREDLEYFETSARNNTGIKEGFAKIASMAFKSLGTLPTKGQKLNNKKKKKKSKC